MFQIFTIVIFSYLLFVNSQILEVNILHDFYISKFNVDKSSNFNVNNSVNFNVTEIYNWVI